MFLLKKIIFKFMELGLGLRTCFNLETKNPIFINFKLTPNEIEEVKKALPSNFRLMPIRFMADDQAPEYWISYNFYELRYPKPELAAIKKSRLEINTFVQDANGRKGIFVFCDSPFVSKEPQKTPLGVVCDFAEWLVTKIYACGQLLPLQYQLSDKLKLSLLAKGHRLELETEAPYLTETNGIKFSSDYCLYNDISFFNKGKTFDFVNVNSSFYNAEFVSVPTEKLETICEGPFFKRRPDSIHIHRGEISYLVNSMNPWVRLETTHV